MNTIDFSKTNGYPFEVDILDFMQDVYSNMIDAIVSAFGNNLIMSGVALSAGNITDGYIIYNNEFLWFEGGAAQDYFTVVEDKTSRMFEDGTYKDILIERKAVLSDNNAHVALSSLKRILPIEANETTFVHQETTVASGTIKELFRIGNGSTTSFTGIIALLDTTMQTNKLFKIIAVSEGAETQAFFVDMFGNVCFSNNIEEENQLLKNRYMRSITNGVYQGDILLAPPGTWWGESTTLQNKPSGFTGTYCLIECYQLDNTDDARYIRLTDLTTLNIYQWSYYSAAWNQTGSIPKINLKHNQKYTFNYIDIIISQTAWFITFYK